MTKANKLEVQKGEQILGYDKDNLKEYRAYQEACAIIEKGTTKGFKRPKYEVMLAADGIIKEYRRKKAATFLEEHKARITYYGVEIKASFDKEFFEQTGMIRPTAALADFNPFKGISEMKPWSEALEENLAQRINCTHKLNEDETACETCGLNPENWGFNAEGVTDEYKDKQRAKIQDQKLAEINCKNGDHKLNEEAEKDIKHKERFCINCRKPQKEWGQEGDKKDSTTKTK